MDGGLGAAGRLGAGGRRGAGGRWGVGRALGRGPGVGGVVAGSVGAEDMGGVYLMADVWTGIDILMREGFARLRGARIGLVTNHTGLTRDGQPTVDALHSAPAVTLAALFGPEHGLRGDKDEDVADGIDARTGLPIYSLFGARTRPTGEQLEGLDTLMFDIQDIGCRFYTYVSTLLGVLEAASEHGLRVVVLDRPNPINGLAVEGPLTDTDSLSFVAPHPLPVRHGLTVGEMARLMRAERDLKCSLEVVPCEGWRRGDWFDATGLLWTDPSPNMRRLTAAALYPGVGLLEFTNVSVGRGTDTPFEVFGAPYVEPRAFAAALNAEDMPGIRFVPVRFTPRASVFRGENCGGVHLIVTDRAALNAVRVGLTLAVTLRHLYPDAWQPDKLQTLLVSAHTLAALRTDADYGELEAGWIEPLRGFEARARAIRLYD